MKTFTTFKKISIGGMTVEKYLSKIENVSNWAKDISLKVICQKKKETVELVIVSGNDLGFSGLKSRKEIYDLAKEHGLYVCPAEVGLALASDYKNQPNGEWFLIGMEPITDSDGDLLVFLVERRGGGVQWLYTDRGDPGHVWRADYRWVFLRRKQSSVLETSELSDPLTLESALKIVKDAGYKVYKEI